MATADSVKEKIQNLINTANEATDGSAEDLTTAIDALVTGYGQSGENFPLKIYETDFAVDDDFIDTGREGVICTISTGMSNNTVTAGREFLIIKITYPQPTDSTSLYTSKVYQILLPNNEAVYLVKNVFIYVTTNPIDNTETAKVYENVTGTCISSINNTLSTISIFGRFNKISPVAGNYHLEMYRTGFSA